MRRIASRSFIRATPGRRPLVMGILNVTPDSFSDGGAFFDPEAAVRRGIAIAREGADLIDIGGESTRPGAAAVSTDEELRRIVPVVRRLTKTVRIPISIDTSKADVAEQALAAGAAMVNDVSALRQDRRMAQVIASAGASVVLMHMRGTPRTMQRRPRYHDVVEEVAQFLSHAAERAMSAGMTHSRIWLDPGLGFGKTVTHNLQLLRSLHRITSLGFPTIIGPSRKSFIGRSLGVDIHERLAGTLACLSWAMEQGVRMVRVHDVRASVQCLDMLAAIRQATG